MAKTPVEIEIKFNADQLLEVSADTIDSLANTFEALSEDLNKEQIVMEMRLVAKDIRDGLEKKKGVCVECYAGVETHERTDRCIS